MKHSFATSKGNEFTVHRKWQCWQTLDSNLLAGELLTGKLNQPQVAVVTCDHNKIYFAITKTSNSQFTLDTKLKGGSGKLLTGKLLDQSHLAAVTNLPPDICLEIILATN